MQLQPYFRGAPTKELSHSHQRATSIDPGDKSIGPAPDTFQLDPDLWASGFFVCFCIGEVGELAG
jgi:hypothetical protein